MALKAGSVLGEGPRPGVSRAGGEGGALNQVKVLGMLAGPCDIVT